MSGGVDKKKNQKGSPKEKILSIYDKLFLGQDITQGRVEFWHDFFLLKANLKGLINHFEKSTPEELFKLRPQLNRLLMQCIQTAIAEKNRIRFANAIQTLDMLVAGVYRCKMTQDDIPDVDTLLLTGDQMKDFMQRYTSLCTVVFREERPERWRTLVLISMRTLATASPYVDSSPFSCGLMDERVFELLRLILINAQLSYHHGLAACHLLGLLMKYGSPEEGSGYPFTQHFAFTDDELLLNGLSSTISHALSEYNLRFQQQYDASSNGILTSVTSFIGSLFVGDVASNASLRPCDSLLLCVYTVTKTTAHFSSLLSYSHAHCATPGMTESVSSLHSGEGGIFDNLSVVRGDTLTPTTFTNNQSFLTPGRAVQIGEKNAHYHHQNGDVHTGTSIKCSMKAAENDQSIIEPKMDDEQDDSLANSRPFACPSAVEGDIMNSVLGEEEEYTPTVASVVHPPMSSLEPRNLLADLLEYCSIIMQDVKTQESLNSCHLCLIIILCITQNPLACSILHDPHVTYKVRIHKPRSRYRKSDFNGCTNFSNRPVAVAILTLLVEFLRGHLMKKLPYRPYMIALSIIHNLICYQKKHKVRLDFEWKQLWTALISLLRFVLKLDSSISISIVARFRLMQKVLRVFNFFILFGDHFLQAADIYDDLYYELIRMHSVFEDTYEHSLSYSTGLNAEIKVVASRVVLYIGNIRSIVNHFQVQIASFLAVNSLTSPTESQVLQVVRENYNSLTLRCHDNLDLFDSHNEKDDQTFFNNLLETLIKHTRKDCLDLGLELQSKLHELSTIH